MGPVGGGYAAIKHLVIELPIQPFETLIQTVAGVQKSLADEGRHLVATRLYSPDHGQAQALRQALAGSGVHDVGLVSEAGAVKALLQTVFRGVALPGAVALVVTAEAATLFALGAAAVAESWPPWRSRAWTPLPRPSTWWLEWLAGRAVRGECCVCAGHLG